MGRCLPHVLVAVLCLMWQTHAAPGRGLPLSTSAPTVTTQPTPDITESQTPMDLNSLIQYVIHNRTGYNISMVVQEYPEACNLVYGSGNPDISGIGAMICYFIQAIGSLLFGPLLTVMCLYFGYEAPADSIFNYSNKLWTAKYFVPVARGLHQTNIIIAFSVLIASITHLQKVCPVADVEFIEYLAVVQVLVAWVSTLSYLGILKLSKARNIVAGLYVIGTFAMTVFVGTLGYPKPYGEALQAITTYCVKHHDWPVPSLDLNPAEPKTLKSKMDDANTLMQVLVKPLYMTAGWFIFLAFRAWTCEVDKVFFSPYLFVCRLLRVGPWRLSGIIGILIPTSFAIAIMGLFLNILLGLRRELRLASPLTYQDNAWGFGQVTAVLTWIPVFQDILFAIGGTIRHFSSRGEETTDRREQHAMSSQYANGADCRDPHGSGSGGMSSIARADESASQASHRSIVEVENRHHV